MGEETCTLEIIEKHSFCFSSRRVREEFDIRKVLKSIRYLLLHRNVIWVPAPRVENDYLPKFKFKPTPLQ